MNKEIELHDSTLDEIKQEGDTITLLFDKAIVHHSKGKPGIDNGTCWVQKIEITLSNAELKNRPNVIPNEIAEGFLNINDTRYENMFETSINAAGEILFELTTGYNEKLNIEAKNIKVTEIGGPVYLQDFSRKN